MLRLRLSRRSLGFLCLLTSLLCLLAGTVLADPTAGRVPSPAASFPYVTPPGIPTDMASNPSYAPGYEAPSSGGSAPDAPPTPTPTCVAISCIQHVVIS